MSGVYSHIRPPVRHTNFDWICIWDFFHATFIARSDRINNFGSSLVLNCGFSDFYWAFCWHYVIIVAASSVLQLITVFEPWVAVQRNINTNYSFRLYVDSSVHLDALQSRWIYWLVILRRCLDVLLPSCTWMSSVLKSGLWCLAVTRE